MGNDSSILEEDTTPSVDVVDLQFEPTVFELVLRGGAGAYDLGVALARYLSRVAEVDASACVVEGCAVLRLCVPPAVRESSDDPIPTLPRLPEGRQS